MLQNQRGADDDGGRLWDVTADTPGVQARREQDTDEGAIDVTEGGTAIPYWLEDPFLRKEYEETLAKEGVTSQMEDALYSAPARAAE